MQTAATSHEPHADTFVSQATDYLRINDTTIVATLNFLAGRRVVAAGSGVTIHG